MSQSLSLSLSMSQSISQCTSISLSPPVGLNLSLPVCVSLSLYVSLSLSYFPLYCNHSLFFSPPNFFISFYLPPLPHLYFSHTLVVCVHSSDLDLDGPPQTKRHEAAAGENKVDFSMASLARGAVTKVRWPLSVMELLFT